MRGGKPCCATCASGMVPWACRAHLRAGAGLVAVSIDVAGAHSSIRRDALHQSLSSATPRLAQILSHWYAMSSRKVWRQNGARRELKTSTGVDQRDPAAAAMYCVGQAAAIEELMKKRPLIQVVAFRTIAIWW